MDDATYSRSVGSNTANVCPSDSGREEGIKGLVDVASAAGTLGQECDTVLGVRV